MYTELTNIAKATHILHTVFYRKTAEWIFTKVLLLKLEKGKQNEGNTNAGAESIRNECNNKVCDKKKQKENQDNTRLT